MEGYPALKPVKKSGAETLHANSKLLPHTLLDFWRWSASDLVSNATRGVLAEYIVASALGLTDGIRTEWDAYDLMTPHGLKIEVKSASYLQSWFHQKPSIITFGIQPTRAWKTVTDLQAQEARRQADVYVFCLLAHTDKLTLDPLNVSQWQFYVVRASVLDAKLPTQKSVRLTSLLRLGVQPIAFDALSACVYQV